MAVLVSVNIIEAHVHTMEESRSGWTSKPAKATPVEEPFIMAKKKGNTALGCLLLILIGVALTAQQIRRNPILAIPIVTAIFLVGMLVAFLFRSRRCELCGNVIERKSHVWTIEGKKKTVCPHCNQSLLRKQSAAATRNFK
jgi:hypothetical protein